MRSLVCDSDHSIFTVIVAIRGTIAEQAAEIAPLWHYKMCAFGTSWSSSAGRIEQGVAKALLQMMLTAIGLMSGTSLDGVDVALIETDGRRVSAFGPSGYRPYTEAERHLLRQALYRGGRPAAARCPAGQPARGRTDRHVGPCRGGGRLCRPAPHRLRGHRYRRLPRPDRAAPARAPADGADRRRRRAGQGDPYPRDARFPRRRRRGRRAGRAVRAGLSPRAGAVAGARGADRRGQYRRRLQHHLYRRRHADRLRHRARQRAARRLHVPHPEPALRHRRAAPPPRARSMRPGSPRAETCRSLRCRRPNRSTATISPR